VSVGRNQPTEHRLTLRFGLYALAALVAAAGVGFALARHNSTSEAKHDATEQTRLISAVLANQLEPADLRRPVGAAQTARLDSFFRTTMPDVPLVKLLGRTGLITYSTDHSLIGKSPDEDREDAEKILRDGSYSDISRLDDGRKVIEAAVPFDADRDGRMDGGIELYRDFAPVAASIRRDFALSATTVALVLLLLYAALFPILRRVLRDRRHFEAALEANEVQHRSLLESLPVMTYVMALGEPTAPSYISPQVQEILGYSPAEWTGDPGLLAKSIHPEDFERVLAAAKRLRSDLTRFSEEYRIVARDGRVVWVLDQTYVVRDAQGQALHLQGVLIDITQRRAGEESLRESEERFRGAFDSSAAGMAMTSRQGGILRANERLCELLGYERHELIGLSFADLTHPDDREARLQDLAKLRGGGDESYEAERRYIRKDGTVVWCRICASAVRDRDGATVYDISQIQDISEERALRESLQGSEQLFRALFSESLLPKLVLDDQGLIVDCNAAHTALVGRPREELIGSFVAAPSATHDLVRGLWEQLLAEGSLRAQFEFERTDGQRRMVDLLAKKDVLPGRHLATMVDLTEQKRLEAQVLQAHKMESVGRLAGGIAHDFNNLLTAIGGYTELMLRRIPKDDPLRHDAEEIGIAAERAAALTRQLLAFSRRQVLQPRLLDMNTVVVEMESMLHRLIGEDVTLETLLEPELGAVRADPGQLEQVILNLAVNARDALPRGGTVTIETSNVELRGADAEAHSCGNEGDFVLLTIADDGHGMDDDVRAQLFEPFFTTKDGQGTGLGLATVYGIVKQSGGYIWVDSEPDAGSRFRVYLPRVEAEAPVAPGPSGIAGETPQGAETILLVEDEEIVRELVKEMLTGFGYSVLEARNGREAIDVSLEHSGQIDLLLSDVIMPGLSGPEAARVVVESRPSTRVLFISGYTDSAIVHHGVLERGTEFLQKPFNSVALAQKVRAVLDGAPLAQAS
jgi:two-component system cell cycle sensor histidine kinase/response regulator CckA